MFKYKVRLFGIYGNYLATVEFEHPSSDPSEKYFVEGCVKQNPNAPKEEVGFLYVERPLDKPPVIINYQPKLSKLFRELNAYMEQTVYDM